MRVTADLIGGSDVTQIFTSPDADAIEIESATSVYINPTPSGIWDNGFFARNTGSLQADESVSQGTNELIALGGLNRFAFTADSIPEAATTIALPDGNNAFFLHDAYSGFYQGLELTNDSFGNSSRSRISNISTISFGNGDGLSVVDLTSPDYINANIDVHGGSNPNATNVFWGTAADDNFISNGANNVIFGGAGSNSISLGDGVDILQYVSNGQAIDTITQFDPAKDRVQLWNTTSSDWLTGIEITTEEGDAIATWEGNTIRFKDLASLAESDDRSWITDRSSWADLIAESLASHSIEQPPEEFEAGIIQSMAADTLFA